MKITIDKLPIGPAQITYRELGFGQNIPGPVLAVVIELSTVEMRAAVREAFNAFVADCEKDDKQYDCSLAVNELVHYGYPSFDEMYGLSKRDLCVVILDYLFFELLGGLFDASIPEDCAYAINSLEGISYDDTSFIVSATAYPLRQIVVPSSVKP